MKILLDTHLLLWLFFEDHLLSEEAKREILNRDNEIYYSVVSLWEVAIKHAAHPEKMFLSGRKFASLCHDSGFDMIPLNDRHVFTLETVRRADGAPPHKDPFDRMLIAQAKAEGMRLLTHDRMLPYYNENCVYLV